MSSNNPVGSTSVSDMFLNAGNLDKALNGNQDSWIDRFGVERVSWSYIEKVTKTGELSKQAREALRRSYAEAGLNMVSGSFEKGGVLVNANDVLLHEATGKCYSGNPGTIPPGTLPNAGGFTDKSQKLFREVFGFLEDFWVAVDLDWTNAFNRAAVESYKTGMIIKCPSKELLISDSIELLTDTTSTGGDFYRAKGSRFLGSGRGTTVRKRVSGTKTVNAAVILTGGRGIGWEGIDILDDSPDSYGIYAGVDVSFSSFKNLFISCTNWGMYFKNNVYVSVEIENIVFASSSERAMKHAIKIPGGTSYKLKNIAAFGITQSAYELAGYYCEVGPLACDDCGGVPYTFSQFDGLVTSLGVENFKVPSIGTLIKVTASSSFEISSLSMFGVNQPEGRSLIDYNGFGRIKISSIRGDGATNLNGSLGVVAGGGSIEVSYCNKSFLQNSSSYVLLGNVAGSQYVQRYGSTDFKYIRIPEAPQNDTVTRYRILGKLNSEGGCLGTITEARGSGSFPRAGVYDISVIGSGVTQYASRIKRAVSDPTSNNYNAWFTATLDGGTYLLCALDTNGTRNLGSYFLGIINGWDNNIFKVVSGSDVTNLAAFAGGVIKTETAA